MKSFNYTEPKKAIKEKEVKQVFAPVNLGAKNRKFMYSKVEEVKVVVEEKKEKVVNPKVIKKTKVYLK